MAAFQRLNFFAGGAAIALLLAVPAQAEDDLTADSLTDVTGTALARVDLAAAEAAIAAVEVDRINELAAEPLAAKTENSGVKATPAAELVATQTLEDFLAASSPANADFAEATVVTLAAVDAVVEEPFVTSAAALDLETAATLSTGTELAEATETVAQSEEVAQVTRPLYRGVTPFYVGFGGNIGIVDSDKSAVGDFGFNIISKISLGPRFAVRPSVQISEDEVSVAIPVTYNFNPIDTGRFSIYPSLGGGVDIGSDLGLLINGGVDIPISRAFTLNSQINWRVTEDTGLGLSLGVAYNFPVFFE
ncbi:MAG: hypothetical protein AAGH67_17705 [Cyanobacteria bacterium P01_H01_bin.162]